MADFRKHRRDNIDIAVGFASALSTGDTLSSVQNVIVTRLGETTDITSQFTSGGSVASTAEDITMTLNASTASTSQTAGRYQLLVEAKTSNGNTLVADDRDGSLPRIKVTDPGDPNV